MIAIRFIFTANRYHATHWARHGDGGVPEWPPSPWCILRSVVATWRRSRSDLPTNRVLPLLEALTSERPRFRLPVGSTGDTRHCTPHNVGAGEGTTLAIDSSIAVRPQDPLYALWPNAELTSGQRGDLDSILRNMPCLGRAESWVAAELVADFPGEANSFSIETGVIPEGDWELVPILTPRTPIRLKDLEVETSDLRGDGRTGPEGAEWWAYVRRRDCFTGCRGHAPPLPGRGEGAQVVRFALAGRVLPMTFDTLRWGELARRSAMAQYGRGNNGEVSQALSGKDASGMPLRGHEHSFYLPTDEDGDGRLDHLTVWTPGGLTAAEFEAVASVGRLNPGGHRDSLRLTCRCHGGAGDFAGVCPLFNSSRVWRSLTPYMLTRHVKFRGPKDASRRREMVDSPREQIVREFSLRWPGGPGPVRVSVADPRKHITPMRAGQSAGFRPFDYFVQKQGGGSNGGGRFNFEVEFDRPVSGPLALGFACHQGLGVFIPADG